MIIQNDTVFVSSFIFIWHKKWYKFYYSNFWRHFEIVMKTIFDQIEDEINILSPKDLEWETKLKVKISLMRCSSVMHVVTGNNHFFNNPCALCWNSILSPRVGAASILSKGVSIRLLHLLWFFTLDVVSTRDGFLIEACHHSNYFVQLLKKIKRTFSISLVHQGKSRILRNPNKAKSLREREYPHAKLLRQRVITTVM